MLQAGPHEMLIAQVTDIHLGFEPGNPAEFNRKRLDQVLKQLKEMNPKPDLLLATGDLTEFGDSDSYRRLTNAFKQVDCRVLPMVGNHDVRLSFAEWFPDVPLADGFVQYVVDADPLRIILIDTLEEGRHGGAFCDVRAAWLNARLDEDTSRPSVIVMHHPPVEVGIIWMNTHPEEDWVTRFRACVAGRRNIVAIICGHLHRAITTQWEGTTIAICPATAPQVALDMSPIDPDKPDNRPMIIADPPAFALHWWNGSELITHFETAGSHVMLAQFDKNMQDLVRGLLAERPS
jgi:Icc protein